MPSETVSSLSAPAPTLSWRVHLARAQRRKVGLTVAVCVLGGACAWMLFESPLPVIAAIGLLVASASDFLFPVTYRLTGSGAQCSGLISRMAIEWRQVKRCVAIRSGVYLSPLEAPSRWDVFRGMELRFAPPGNPGDRRSVAGWLAALEPSAPECLSDAVRCSQEGSAR